MGKGAQTRARMIASASQLFQSQGYAATGLKQILADSGAPRGSMYFHFPGGKEELAAEVVADHAARFADGLRQAIAGAPSALVAAQLALRLLADQLEASACASGCPVTVIALEMANRSEPLREATRSAYQQWIALVSERLVAEGLERAEANQRGRALLSAIEGALVLSRAFGDAGPLHDLEAVLPALLGPAAMGPLHRSAVPR